MMGGNRVASNEVASNGLASLKLHPSTLALFALSQAHVVPLKPRLRAFHKKKLPTNFYLFQDLHLWLW